MEYENRTEKIKKVNETKDLIKIALEKYKVVFKLLKKFNHFLKY